MSTKKHIINIAATIPNSLLFSDMCSKKLDKYPNKKLQTKNKIV